jgi:hypothetical protein
VFSVFSFFFFFLKDVRCHSLVQKSILFVFSDLFFFCRIITHSHFQEHMPTKEEKSHLSTGLCWFLYSMIIEEVEADTRNLQRASFKHENCASNSEVHRLARLAVSSSLGRQVWLLQPPGGLSIPNNVYDQ